MAPIPPLPDLLNSLPFYQPPPVLSPQETLLDVLRGCAPFLPSDSDKPQQLCFQYVNPILQEGPTCGIVAVAMLSSLIPRKLPVLDLLEDAQALGYSKSGEMFSVDNMAAFLRHEVGEFFAVQVFSDGLAQRKDQIVGELLTAKALYLVPYDADKDNSPVCLRGHKAHWALLCGAVTINDNSYVLARQGKSRHMGVWPIEDLDRSNANLTEICPCRQAHPEKYVLHDLQTSMAGKYIKLLQLDI